MTQTASTATEKNASKKDVQRMAEEKFSDRSPLLKRTKAAPGTIKRLFGYIFKFKIQVAIVVSASWCRRPRRLDPRCSCSR